MHSSISTYGSTRAYSLSGTGLTALLEVKKSDFLTSAVSDINTDSNVDTLQI